MSSTLTTTTVCTIGYQGVSIDEFIARLREEGIDTIIDVRANPVSRKPGFSKFQLESWLMNAGIKYYHFPKLGIPSRYRKEHLDYDSLFFLYEQDILPKAREDVALAVQICGNSCAALLCFEKSPAECHRSRLAKYMRDRYGTKTRHIIF